MKVVIFAITSWLMSSAAGLPSGPDRHAASPPIRASFRDKVTTHYIPMRKHDLPVSANHGLQRRIGGPTSLRNAYDVYYIVDLVVGNQTIPVSVDTGSSDTWLVQEPYECVSFWFDPGGVSLIWRWKPSAPPVVNHRLRWNPTAAWGLVSRETFRAASSPTFHHLSVPM